MELHHLLRLFLSIILSAQYNHGSLLSRFKNAHTYEPVQVDLDETPLHLEEMQERDPELLRDLLEELPELKIILNAIRNNKSQQTYYFAPTNHIKKNQGYVPTTRLMREEIVKLFKNNNTSQTSTIRHQMIMQSNHSNTQIYPRNYAGRRWPWIGPDYTGPLMASCYECGHSISGPINFVDYGHIPFSSLCHDAFESPNWKARTLARYFRTKCYLSGNSVVYKKIEYQNPLLVVDFKGYIRHNYYRGYTYIQCFKRFLDVGSIYTQRGCRTWPPHGSNPMYGLGFSNFATHRYIALERAFGQFNYKNKCIYSPAASLTPFARGISLFARYHVCMCYGKYCNSSNSATSSKLLTFLACTILIYCNF